jgi:hypothetical protein
MKKSIPAFIILSVLLLSLIIPFIPVTASGNLQLNKEDIEKNDTLIVLLRDDFDDYSTNWRVGTQFSQYTVYDGLGELTIHRAWRFMYTNAELTGKPEYQYNNMKIRAKIDPIIRGSKGWGLWNHKYAPKEIAYTWFVFLKGSTIYPYNGFWIMSVDGTNGYTFKKINGIDVREWHDYEIIWDEDSYDFIIDGENVAHITTGVTQDKLGVEVWNDNSVYYFLKTKTRMLSFFPMAQRISQSGSIFIDYIEITE